MKCSLTWTILKTIHERGHQGNRGQNEDGLINAGNDMGSFLMDQGSRDRKRGWVLY